MPDTTKYVKPSLPDTVIIDSARDAGVTHAADTQNKLDASVKTLPSEPAAPAASKPDTPAKSQDDGTTSVTVIDSAYSAAVIPVFRSKAHTCYFDDPDCADYAASEESAAQPHEVAPSEMYGSNSVSPHAATAGSFEYKEIKRSDSLHEVMAVSLVMIFTILMIYAGKFVTEAFKTASQYHLTNKRYLENSTSDTKTRAAMVAFFMLVLPLFIYLVADSYTEINYFYLFLIFSLLAGVWLVQSAAVKICAAVTLSKPLISEITYNRQLAAGIAGILLFPVTLVMLLYNDTQLYNLMVKTGGGILGLLIIFVIIRTFATFSAARISVFLRFLYLCTFEISPYLVLYIVFQQYG